MVLLPSVANCHDKNSDGCLQRQTQGRADTLRRCVVFHNIRKTCKKNARLNVTELDGEVAGVENPISSGGQLNRFA